MATMTELDPVRYEIFIHRLWAIGEEGRVTLQRVSASPIITQGGECMQSFYNPEGRMVFACSGHLRFAAATSDAIRKMIEWFQDNPGIHEGDQFFFNDPYVAGSHTYDQMCIMPIFHEGRLVAWTASSSHTADVGGNLRGGSTEIFHEGVRILGLKVVEGGTFRNDVCKTIVEQCRDPKYVELDLRSRIAGNNVTAKRFLDLIDQFGVDFVEAACQKMIDDSERMARAKLRDLPDGTWRSRVYGSWVEPFKVVCQMTKTGEDLFFDFTGSSRQLGDEMNSTFPSSMAHLALALTNGLFWDIPWSDGKMGPVHVTIPQGTIVNCDFPAACASAPMVGMMLVSAVMDCVAKMLYAGGRYEDVNAGWYGLWYEGGPGFFYGGHNSNGVVVAQGLYDIHGGGFGATPDRDGVDTGGHINIPSGGISDVEIIELQYPFLYFSRNHNPNGAGYGRFRGGDGSSRVLMVYGSQDLTVNMRPYGGLPHGGYGLFGGYPTGSGGLRAIYETDSASLKARLEEGTYPTSPRQVLDDGWAAIKVPKTGRHPVPEGWLISDFVQGGGGFGDPLERDAAAVVADVGRGIYTAWAAEKFFAVVLDGEGGLNPAGTESLRETRRRERLAAASPVASAVAPRVQGPLTVVAKPHASLEIVSTPDGHYWRCQGCATVLGPAPGNYKEYASRRVVPLDEVAEFTLIPDQFIGEYHEYLCPGCGVLLQVDVFCPDLGGDSVYWDVDPRL